MRKALAVAIVVVLGFFNIGSSRSVAQSATVPGNTTINDLEHSADFLFELEDEVVTDAEIYASKRQVAYLVVTPRLESPLLISPRGNSVQTIQTEKLTVNEHTATLAADFTLEHLGEFESRRGEMLFQVGGKAAKLKPAPPLLGHQSTHSLGAFDPKLTTKAKAYSMKSSFNGTALPVAGESIRIRTYFGSWSEVSNTLVPKIMQVEEQWGPQGVRFEYYGLPQPITDDQAAVKDGILGVPTAVLYVNDEEVGRLSGRPLNTPEESFHRVLSDVSTE